MEKQIGLLSDKWDIMISLTKWSFILSEKVLILPNKIIIVPKIFIFVSNMQGLNSSTFSLMIRYVHVLQESRIMMWIASCSGLK